MSAKPKSTKLKKTLDSTWPDTKRGVKLTDEQVDALIEQLREIAQANIDLITETEAARIESELMRKRARVLQWTVSLAFILGSFVAIAVYLNVKAQGEFVRTEINAAREDFKVLDKNVALTLGVARANSEALAAKVRADVGMDGESEAEAVRKADEAQAKALEAETKIQKDPAKKAKAEKKLKAFKKERADDDALK